MNEQKKRKWLKNVMSVAPHKNWEEAEAMLSEVSEAQLTRWWPSVPV